MRIFKTINKSRQP